MTMQTGKSGPSETPEFAKEEVSRLLRLLTEATRATPHGGPSIYVPPAGAEMASANYHHFIFGQRGSGKSSLLRHLQSELEAESRGAIWMDQEIFSALKFPDVLVSAVLETSEGLRRALPAPHKVGWWKRMFAPPEVDPLNARLDQMIANLRALKQSPSDRQIQWTHKSNSKDGVELLGTITTKNVGLKAGSTSASDHDVTSVETVSTSKEEYLELALTDFRSLFTEVAAKLQGGFIFVDDLYHLNRADQPRVLGYMHRLVKDTGLWLKIGTLRSATTIYRSNPPQGMQLRHDAQEIALDRQFRLYGQTKEFLETILGQICHEAHVDMRLLITQGALDRLMLASGGVARDYLVLASGAINKARSRGPSSKTGTGRVIVEDVNGAAADIAPSKLSELKEDVPQEARDLEARVYDLTEFCRHTGCAYFLVDTQDEVLGHQIDALQNLRFTNLIHESETIPDRASQRFNVWLLDVAMLSAQRAAQKIDFDGWERREQRRQRRLIYSSDWKIRQGNPGRDSTGKFSTSNAPRLTEGDNPDSDKLF